MPSNQPSSSLLPAERLLNAHGIFLRSYAPSPDDYTLPCPKCSPLRRKKDATPLSVKITPDDRAYWHCNHCEWRGPAKGALADVGLNGPRPDVPRYVYRTPEGVPVSRKVRNPPGARVRFFWEHLDESGEWVKGGHPDHKQLLYRIDEVRQAIAEGHPVRVVEGEKDADNLWAIGVPATCSPHGAAETGKKPKWLREHSEQLRGAHIIVFNDNDNPGYAHAAETCRLSLGVAARVKRLDLKNDWPDIPPGGDVSDWIARGGTTERLISLESLVPLEPDSGTPASKAPSKPQPDKFAELLAKAEALRTGDITALSGLIEEMILTSLLKVQCDRLIEAAADATNIRLDKVRELLREAEAEQARKAPSAPDDAAELERLARLSTFDFDREREKAAKKLGVRRPILEAAVKAKRADLGLNKKDGLQGHAVEYEEPEPWPEPVDIGALLDEIARSARRFVVLPKHGDTKIALWVAHTYVPDATDITPRLQVQAEFPNSGKTTTLEYLELVIYRPDLAANITVAAFFRTVDQHHPALLIDEIDSFVTDDSELVNVFNSGHSVRGRVKRTVGDNHEVRSFSTFAAVAYAHNGTLPRRFVTLVSRSIKIALKRRTKNEPIEPLRKARRRDEFKDMRRKLKRFANDHAAALTNAEPEMPEGLVNRIADNYRPLLAIADLAGGEWPKRARDAISNTEAANSEREVLLADIRAILARSSLKDDFINSTLLVKELAKIDERPWAAYGRQGKPITTRRVGSLLGTIDIHPRPNKAGAARGYYRTQFDDAFARYLDPVSSVHADTPLPQCQSVRNADEMGTSGTFQHVRSPDLSDMLENAGNADGTSTSDTLTRGEGGILKKEGVSDTSAEAADDEPTPDEAAVSSGEASHFMTSADPERRVNGVAFRQGGLLPDMQPHTYPDGGGPGIPVRIAEPKTPAEARALPEGALYRHPNGELRTR